MKEGLILLGSKGVRWLAIVLATLLIADFYQQFRTGKGLVAQAATTIPGKGTQSDAPIGMLGFYLTTGFNLQPDDSYTSVNHPRILTTSTVHSLLSVVNIFASDHFQWAQSTNEGKQWTDVNGASSADLEVTPTKVGTVYYQQRFQYFFGSPIPFVTPTYYSRVAALTTLPDPVPATGLSVTADSDYLYNNQEKSQQTYVHATPTPVNATGNLDWTSSDPCLATVTSKGLVTANKSGKVGTVQITGAMTNDNGRQVTAAVSISIGGGLDDQKVAAGQTATFRVRGKFEQAPALVTWHRVAADGRDTVVSRTTQLSYTTPATTMADDQANYYAEIKVSDDVDQVLTTGRAKLTVIPDRTPAVTVMSTVRNLTDDKGNTPTMLTNVINGDTCVITGAVTDKNAQSRLVDGDFMIKLPGDATDTAAKVDGQPAHYYTVVQGMDVVVVVSGQSFTDVKTHSFSIKFTTHKTNNLVYKTGVQLMGYADTSRSHVLDTYQGNDVILNFTDGQLSATANDVDFGQLTMTNVGQELPGKALGDGELLDVTDHRRVKAASQVELRQEAALNNGATNLAATLTFTKRDGLSQTLSSANQVVGITPAGTLVPPIGEAQGDHLNVKVSDGAFQPGRYTTKLDWTVVLGP